MTIRSSSALWLLLFASTGHAAGFYIEGGINMMRADELGMSSGMQSIVEREQSFLEGATLSIDKPHDAGIGWHSNEGVGDTFIDITAGYGFEFDNKWKLDVELDYSLVGNEIGIVFFDNKLSNRGVGRLKGTWDMTRYGLSVMPTYPVSRHFSVFMSGTLRYTEVDLKAEYVTLVDNYDHLRPALDPGTSFNDSMSGWEPAIGVGFTMTNRQTYARWEVQRDFALDDMLTYRLGLGYRF